MTFVKLAYINTDLEKVEAIALEKNFTERTSAHLDGCSEGEIWVKHNEDILAHLVEGKCLTQEEAEEIVAKEADEILFY